MSRRGITLPWADSEYPFKLTFDGLRELQETTGFGPQKLVLRFEGSDWSAWELRETMRIALIGGGLAPLDALALVRRYIENRPLLESIVAARAILMETLVGVPDEVTPGKKPGPKAKTDQTEKA